MTAQPLNRVDKEIFEIGKKLARDFPPPAATQSVVAEADGIPIEIVLRSETRYIFAGRFAKTIAAVHFPVLPTSESGLYPIEDPGKRALPLDALSLERFSFASEDGRRLVVFVGYYDARVDDLEAQRMWPNAKRLIRTVAIGGSE